MKLRAALLLFPLVVASCGGEIEENPGEAQSGVTSDDLENTRTTESALTSTLAATGDTTVRSGSYASSNYGSSTTLRVDGENLGTVQEVYLKFAVSSLPTGSRSVTLALSISESGSLGTLYRTSDFSESTLTWNNRPAKGAAVVNVGLVSTGTKRIDLTSVVTAPGTYAFVFSSTSTDGASIRSRETSDKPVLEVTSADTPPPPTCGGSQMECDVLTLINQSRAAQSLPALAYSSKLSSAALSHNQWMTSHNCIGHNCPGEPTIGTRLTNAGYTWASYGETVAAGYKTAQAVVDGWMASPGHHAILMGNYKDIGLSVLGCTSGCTYNPYWTADFGVPR
jgi:uncharacterized protein YkwD